MYRRFRFRFTLYPVLDSQGRSSIERVPTAMTGDPGCRRGTGGGRPLKQMGGVGCLWCEMGNACFWAWFTIWFTDHVHITWHTIILMFRDLVDRIGVIQKGRHRQTHVPKQTPHLHGFEGTGGAQHMAKCSDPRQWITCGWLPHST